MMTMGITMINKQRTKAYSCDMLGFVRPENSLGFALISDLQPAYKHEWDIYRRKLTGTG